MGEVHSRVTFGTVNKLVVPELLETTYIDRFIKLIDPAERKIIPHHSRSVLILMVHDALSKDKGHNSNIHQSFVQELALSPTPNRRTAQLNGTTLRLEAVKNLKLAQRKYKLQHDRDV